MSQKKKKVAAFDVDGTIFRSSLLIELIETLIDQGIFPKKARAVYRSAHLEWLERRGSYDVYLGKVIRAFDRHIRGVREKDFLRAVSHVLVFHENRVYRYTRDLVHTLRKKGYFLLAISHSPKYAVDRFAKKLGFHKVYGMVFELDRHRRFTGQKLHLEEIKDKGEILRRAVRKEGLNLEDSYGVGDSESDIPFLSRVAHPICFNPSSGLYCIAERKGWQVVVERKDVIYKLR